MRLSTTKSDAELHLEMIYEEMVNCINFAFKHFVNSQDNAMRDTTSVIYDKRTRANIIYNAAVSQAKSLFLENQNIKMCTQRGIFFIIVNSRLIIRFKKFDKKRYSGNVKTKLATSLNNQENVAGIENDLPLIELGYRLNKSQCALQDILFVYRKDAPVWSIPIYNGELSGDINFEPNNNESQVVEKRIRLRLPNTERKSGS